MMILGIYLPVMRVEAETLSGLFGKKYARYASEVPLFLPRFSPYRQKRDGFRSRTCIFVIVSIAPPVGTAIAWALLAAKAIYFK